SDDHHCLAMCLETYDAVDHVRSGFFQASRPLNITRLIKTRAQLDDRSDLFSCVRRVDECLNKGRITAGAVQSYFHRKHLRIFCCRLNQLDDFIKTVVRMMQQDVLSSQHLEEIRVWRQCRIASGLKWTVLQLGKRVVGNQRSEMRHGQRSIEF